MDKPEPKGGPAPYTGGGDLWERIQNESRKGAFQDEYTTVDPFRNYSDQISHLDGNNLTPDQQKYLDKYGIKMGYTPGYTSGPMGEGATVENVPGQWHQTSGSNTYDPSKNPKTVFGHDFRLVTERDKGLIPKEDAIVWDDNYGWITHKKNYNQNGNETWFMQNAKTIMPALLTAGLGFAGVAPGVLSGMNLGRGAVDFLGGNRSLQSLLPQLISAGLPFIPGFGDMGRLAQGLTRTGTGFFGNMLLNNNRGGRG
jgi:hypothetical protein